MDLSLEFSLANPSDYTDLLNKTGKDLGFSPIKIKLSAISPEIAKLLLTGSHHCRWQHLKIPIS